MPKLTPAAVEKYAPQEDRREIPDSLAPGLRLVVQAKPSGTKSWAMRFRRPSGKPAKLTLGRVELGKTEADDEPVLGGALTLRQARQLANKIDRERARGIDVIEAYKASKLRQRVAAADRAANTFGAAARAYIVDHKTTRGHSRPRRWRDSAALLGLRWQKGTDPAKTDAEIIRGGLADVWHDKPVAAIDGHDIHAVVVDARKHNDSRARKMHAALSGLFSWLQRQRRITQNPTDGIWRPGAPRARERVLADAEIVKFWAATDKAGEPFSSALKLLLLTGARRGEVAGMRYNELNDGIWTIPADRTKNWRTHYVPLPPLAREIIAGVPHIEGPLLFTTNGRTQISGWSRCKRQLDATMGIPHWRLHDLRRTAASGMQRLGVRTEVIERALNHISGSFSGIVSTYQTDPLSDEVRAALLRWSQHVSGLVAGRPGKVVALRK